MIDLLMGGSPCQGFSFAGKQLNFEDKRSKLFFDFVRAKEELKPKYFLLENVKMKKEHQNVISKYLGVEPIEINSALVSAQNRKRLYWTNIPGIEQPEDKQVYLKDILESGEVNRDKSYCIDASYYKGVDLKTYFEKHRRQLVFESTQRIDVIGKGGQGQRIYDINGKSVALSALGGGQGAKTGLYLIVGEATKKGYAIINKNEGVDLTFINSKTRRGRRMKDKSNCLTAANYDYCWYDGVTVRKLTPIECERLQTLPDNFTEGISNSQRYKALGNGWTVDVIAHILSHIPEVNLHTVVSLFDGISCGQVALERANKSYNQYYASEIDKYVMQVTMKNYPHTIQLGDITKINWDMFLSAVSMFKQAV